MSTEVELSTADALARTAAAERRYLSAVDGRAKFREAFKRARAESKTARESLLNARKTNAALGSVIDDLNMEVFALEDGQSAILARAAALESQLGQAHADLLLAQADAETLRAAALDFLAANNYSLIGSRRARLRELARTAHPGQALADEVAAARAAITALVPFAAFARVTLAQMEARDAPMRDADIVMMIDDCALTVGDLRRAVGTADFDAAVQERNHGSH